MIVPVVHKSAGSSQDCRRGCAEWSNSLGLEYALVDVRENGNKLYSVIGASPKQAKLLKMVL
jgi:hypothetical protein